MTPELEGVQTGRFQFEVTARPAHGRPVTLYVRYGTGNGFHVKADPESLGFITKHSNFEAAVKSSTYRAKRYLRAYSKPRGLAAKAVTA